jgi:hypothetical protein
MPRLLRRNGARTARPVKIIACDVQILVFLQGGAVASLTQFTRGEFERLVQVECQAERWASPYFVVRALSSGRYEMWS